MTPEDMKLAVLAIMSFMSFMAAVLKSYQRNSLLYDPVEELFLHILTLVMPTLLISFSTQFNKPIFVTMGYGMFAVLAIYYCRLFEAKKRKIADAAAVVAMLIILAAGLYAVVM